MRFLFILLLTLFAPPLPPPSAYVVPGATVTADMACSDHENIITYHLTANNPSPGRYRIASLDAYPTVSLLMTVPGQAELAGDTIRWHPHSTADELWVIGGGMAGCPTAVGGVENVGRVFAPLVSH